MSDATDNRFYREPEARTSDPMGTEFSRIQRRVTADRILEEISKDLHAAPCGWAKIDVDDRNAIISGWRLRIISELERYF